MTYLFMVHSESETECAGQIRKELEANGYKVWQGEHPWDPHSFSYAHALESALLGSSTIVVIWSAAAAQIEWVERKLLFAQRLKTPVLVVQTDPTDLPRTLIDVQPIAAVPPCKGVVEQLLPQLPPIETDDALLGFIELMSHERIRERRKGIEMARKLLQNAQIRQRVLAVLEYVARNDLIIGVRELAQTVLDNETFDGRSPIRPEESRHFFGVKCRKGHVTYFDKRHICSDASPFTRNLVQRAGAELDEIILKCGEVGCSEEMSVHVDCEGYK
jgi:hypothetical protein